MPTIDTMLREARLRLSALPTPGLDARLMLQAVTGLDAAGLLSEGEVPVSPDMQARFAVMVQRRAGGEPVARILGFREFYGHRLQVTPAVLDPRPDTEVLVETILARLPAAASCRLLDLGTGSGAIVLAVLAERRLWQATAVDVSAPALAVARHNAEGLGVQDRLTLREGTWFGPVEGRFDAIVSNPPYIPQADIAGLAVDVRAHDPHLALDGGPDGLDCYRAIAQGAPAHLLPGGFVAVEIGMGQAAEVTTIFAQNGLKHLATYPDLAGIDRVLVFAAAVPNL